MLLAAVAVGCHDRATTRTAEAGAPAMDDRCGVPGDDDKATRAVLLRCIGVAPSPLDPIRRAELGDGALLEARVASDASRGTDMAPPDLLVVWVDGTPPGVRAWGRSNAREGILAAARLATLGGERVIVERAGTSWGANDPWSGAVEIVWLVRGTDLVRAGRYVVQTGGGFGSLGSKEPSSTYVATSSFVARQIFVDEQLTWHYPGLAETRRSSFRRTYTLTGDVLVADSTAAETPPPFPSVTNDR